MSKFPILFKEIYQRLTNSSKVQGLRFVDLFGTHQVPQFETKVQEVEVGERDGWMMVDGWGRGFGGGTKQCLFNAGGR